MGNPNVLYRILAVERIIQDNPQGITVKQIIEKLDNYYGITADRKTIYRNIAALTRFMPIYQTRREKSIENIYCLAKE